MLLNIITGFGIIIISVLRGFYFHREVYNFEHVNLFGSYLVFSSMFFIIYADLTKLRPRLSLKRKRKLKIYQLLFTGVTILSTSTGSILTQFTSWLPINKIRFRNILMYLFLLIAIVFLFYVITEEYAPKLFNKLFGTFTVLDNLGLSKFYNQTKNWDLDFYNLQDSGSFTWRLGAYIFYINKIFNQDFIHILLGNGNDSFSQFASFMPHNDFIMILIDYGLVGLCLMLRFLILLYRKATKRFTFIKIFIIFIFLRLGFENIIYSNYLLSCIAVVLGIVLALNSKIRKAIQS